MARTFSQELNTNLKLPCPCGDGLSGSLCCAATGRWYKQPPNIRPPNPATGFALQACYLSALNDCCETLSDEHYISEAVLKVLGDEVEISGSHWLPEGQSKILPVKRLTARILCKRHNEALSALDAIAGRFFGHLRAVQDDLHEKSLSKRGTERLFSGEALELWMLKVAVGYYFGRISSNEGKPMKDTHGFNWDLFLAAAFEGKWEPNCGLYFRGGVGTTTTVQRRIQVASTSDTETINVTGTIIRLAGFDFALILDPAKMDFSEFKAQGWDRHPTVMRFYNNRRHHLLQLSWALGNEGRAYNIRQQLKKNAAT